MPINEKATPRQMSWNFPTVAAGTGATFAIWVPSFAGELVAANISDHAGVNPSATSYTTISIVDNTTTTHTLATINNTATTFTQDTMVAMTVSATNTNKRWNGGDAIIVTKADTAGGSAWTSGILHIEFVAGTYDA